MPVCPSCFAYYVRAPCPYCSDTGQPATIESRTQSWNSQTIGVRASEETYLKKQVEDLQGKVELLQKENQSLKGELTEKTRIIARLEAELRSSQDDRNFLLSRLSELEGTEPVAIAPETKQKPTE